MICSVCIATYKRSQLLRKLLDSIVSQYLPDNIKLQVIVVDNDMENSAEHIVKEYENRENISFEYFVQPEKNISLTRNVAVKNSKGEFLLFIDDDEEAEKAGLPIILGLLINTTQTLYLVLFFHYFTIEHLNG